MMRFLVPIVAMASTAAPAAAQDAKGSWTGVLQVNTDVRLNIGLHIRAMEDGALQGTMDSPDQGAYGIPIADIAATDGSLAFNVPSIAGRYEARWDAGGKQWQGQWSQGGVNFPLALKAAPPPAPRAPLPTNWEIPSDSAIGALIEKRIAGRQGTGMVIGVIDQRGRHVIARGPVGATGFDGKTVFEIGSISKVFTALLLADMVERGEVKLDDPAEKYLPAGHRMPERSGRKITLADLANHRSGLPRLPDNMPYGDLANPYADYGEALLLAFLDKHVLSRDVDSQFEYSNLGMGLLGYLLSRRAGTDYETLVRTRITGPLGMKDTMIVLSADAQARFATGHDAMSKPTKPWDLPALAGAGGIRSTADDMLRFLSAFLEPNAPTPAMQRMTAQRWGGASAGVDIGLGWMMAKAPWGTVMFHDGGTGGFRTSMAWDPLKRRAVVVLTNSAAEPSATDLMIHLMAGLPAQ